jgi:hypothetical protein
MILYNLLNNAFSINQKGHYSALSKSSQDEKNKEFTVYSRHE